MSRTQWWSLTALLAVVVGLLCGPVATAGAAEAAIGASAPAVSVAQTQTQTQTQTHTQAQAQAQAHVQAQAHTQTRAKPRASMAEAADADTPVPGCGKLRDHDGEPAVPSRARSAYDQAPGLAPWGLPVATGALSAEPPPGMRARAPAPYTPTPVELSVLRV
ncbi:hypothetical protein ASD97_06535 [Streptomyces sp. Root63]|uniref:hypothetical protein n=1 Tax=unclassified Streptomyces TaxID=2593676 RepID=UPI0006F6C12B|nr:MULTISPECIES: hypothetical protein [unclassified Streptomyces]KQX37592.1 hypothetical protein ASD29_10685 [Streptomyces sp. Root1295]KRA43337.1 hypothetical protein ASD97_06535 [Streptomyces sp. Root63]